MLPTFYNNNYQIIQTHDHLIILVEMIHDVRIIPLDGRPHGSYLNGWATRGVTGKATRLWWKRSTSTANEAGLEHP